MTLPRNRMVPLGETITNDQLAWEFIQDGTFIVDDDGAIWRNGERAERLTTDGYGRVSLGLVNGKRRSIAAHRIVWMAIRGEPIPWGFQVNHINGFRWDNTPRNLELVSAYGNGLHARGERYYSVPAVQDADEDEPPHYDSMRIRRRSGRRRK